MRPLDIETTVEYTTQMTFIDPRIPPCLIPALLRTAPGEPAHMAEYTAKTIAAFLLVEMPETIAAFQVIPDVVRVFEVVHLHQPYAVRCPDYPCIDPYSPRTSPWALSQIGKHGPEVDAALLEYQYDHLDNMDLDGRMLYIEFSNGVLLSADSSEWGSLGIFTPVS